MCIRDSDSEESPFDRVFDHRQNQVRIFYNVALSKLMTTYFNHLNTQRFPPLLKADGHEYHVNFDHALDVQKIEVDTFRSSYNMNFSGFNTVNRKDGLGAEFIVGRKENDVNHGFILDPDNFYAHQANPNIHLPRFFPATAIAYPKQKATADQVIAGAELEISMFDPYRQDRVKIEGVDYPLTANYSAPYGLWLSKYNLGAAGYWSLINKEANLIMPHLYMLEPFNPNKKIIVFVHGLASSPEAVSYTHLAVNLDFKTNQRVVELVQGQIYVDVAKDKTRPFLVKTSHGQIQALGTAFSVSYDSSATELNMLHSKVKVEATQVKTTQLHATRQAIVEAGQAIKMDQNGVQKLPELNVYNEQQKWQKHQLMVDVYKRQQIIL